VTCVQDAVENMWTFREEVTGSRRNCTPKTLAIHTPWDNLYHEATQSKTLFWL